MAKITMNLWVIALIENVSGPVNPLYFYNPYKDVWTKEQTLGCGFSSEQKAYDKLEELGVHADIILVTANLN